MKKILMLLIIAGAVYYGGGGAWISKTTNKFLVKNVQDNMAELNAVVEPMIRDMAAHQWDQQSIEKYASPALKQWMVANRMVNGMPQFRVLGNVKYYRGVNQFMNMSGGSVNVISGVQFDNGEAKVTMLLTKQNGTWAINSVNVASQALGNPQR